MRSCRRIAKRESNLLSHVGLHVLEVKRSSAVNLLSDFLSVAASLDAVVCPMQNAHMIMPPERHIPHDRQCSPQ
jgi:hypothetical protein